MTANPFVLKPTDYKRKYDFVKYAAEDYAKYLQKMTGRDYEYCLKYVKEQLSPQGALALKDPKVRYLRRNEWGDRAIEEGTLMGYMGEVIQNNQLMAPTFTVYDPPSVNPSIIVSYIENNIEIRNKAKKIMFKARMDKNKRLQMFKKNEQSNKKILTNAITGAHVSSSTPLMNKTAHSTLTSNCRSTSAFGNANNEKLLAGNRHYHHPTILINNIASITNRTDLKALQVVMEKYKLHYPTPEEAFECAERSFRTYWRSPSNERRAFELLQKLEPIERAAFVYIGDLYHIRKHNDAFMRTFIGGISDRTLKTVENPENIFSSNRGEYVGLVVQLFGDMMRGKRPDDVRNETVYKMLACNIEKIHEHLIEHTDFIKAIFVTDNVPASLSMLPESIRHVALTSDTDSTIFTVEEWVLWKHGNMAVTDETSATCATMIFLAAESITHILACMSANFGVIPERIFQVAMKNEFRFDTFTPTNIGKHYFALIGSQEGDLLAEYEMEKKGVHLRSASIAGEIINEAEKMMYEISELAMKAEPFRIFPFLKRVADMEREVRDSIFRGERKYLRNGQIKNPKSYTKSERESPFQHYLLWNEVFASKYDQAPEPPYSCSKVSISLKNQKAIQAWIDTIEDPFMRANANEWNKENKKATLNQLLIPSDNLSKHGMPLEIRHLIDIRRSIIDVTKIFYIIFEALGIYIINDKLTRLLIDEF